ncbi:MAG: RNA pseudouridine synthase [bacterium]|nr:RNA pseudouridine synthase [bacterium]
MRRQELSNISMDLTVLYEDNHIIAVEKEAGILSQQDISGESSLLDMVREYIRVKYNKPGNVFLGLVHRLDRPVSGVMVFARTSKAASRLHEQFLGRQVNKLYLALVPKTPIPVDTWISLKQSILKRKGYSEITDEKTACSKPVSLRYRLLGSDSTYSLLLIDLHSGKKHQIRAQLSSQGMPIIGDKKYGSHEKCGEDSICLHALHLSFTHPTQKTIINLFSPPPPRIYNKFSEFIDTDKIVSIIENSRK